MDGLTDEIRARIREVQVASGLSERAFSRKAGLTPTHLGQIISNRTAGIGLGTLEAIARVGGVSVDYLATGRRDSRQLTADVEKHASPQFAPAARAFIELHGGAPEAAKVVARFLHVRFDPEQPWTSDEWLDELRTEFRRERRRVRFD